MSRESLNLPYITLAGVIVIAILFVFLVIQPTITKIGDQRTQVERLNAQIIEKEEFLMTIDRKKTELLAQQANENVLGVVLPADDALDDISRLLNRYALASGVTINSVDHDVKQAAAQTASARARNLASDVPTDVYPIITAVDVTGSYQQFRSFIESLQKSSRLGDIRSAIINRHGQQPDVINAKVEVRFYKYQPNPNGV